MSLKGSLILHTELDPDTAKPEVQAQKRLGLMTVPQVVEEVTEILGSRLTATIAGIKDARTLRNWTTRNASVPHVPGRRLQVALNAIYILDIQYQRDEIAGWFTWLSDELSDQSPAVFLRKAETDAQIEQTGRELRAAARAHLVQ